MEEAAGAGENPSAGRRLLGYLKQAVGLATIAWLAYYLYRHGGQMRVLLEVSWWLLSLTAAGVLVTWVLVSAQGWLLLRALGARLGFAEHLLLQLASMLANYLPLRMGVVLRLHYLKRVHGLGYARFGGLVGVRAVLLLLCSSFMGLAGLAGMWLAGGAAIRPELVGLLGALAAASVLALVAPIERLAGRAGRLGEVAGNLLAGMALVRSRPGLFAGLCLLLGVQIAVVAFRLRLTYQAVQLEPPAPMLLTVAAVAALVNLLAFTMASLGVREAAIGFATEATGFEFSRGIFAGILDRVVLMALTYTCGGVALALVYRRLGRVAARPEKPLC